ncbi:hypothetical protein OROMI_003458 [Orobanche minor]
MAIISNLRQYRESLCKSVCCVYSNPVPLVLAFRAKLWMLENVYEGEKLYLYIHYVEMECEIKNISKFRDFATIEVEELICAEKYRDVPALGRIVAHGKVIYWGVN